MGDKTETGLTGHHSNNVEDKQVLQDRLFSLESKVEEQKDEIVCLRGTLADLLRRVTTLEASRGNKSPLLLLSFSFL